ncbi:hypothetical protein ABIB90_000533 [Bradyrhizobium sp. JR4.1]|uniref:hypothetical protein n=1 Tax=Bradyrhizobium sp. JR4.1 TaxID=3156372 RepID=UPI00339A282C
MTHEPSVHEHEGTAAQLMLKATYWREEARRFVGKPEERWCIDYAEHAETLAELERLKALD